MACGICGKEGHNRRTCANNSDTTPNSTFTKQTKQISSNVQTNARAFSSIASVKDVKEAIASGSNIIHDVRSLHEIHQNIKSISPNESFHSKQKSIIPTPLPRARIIDTSKATVPVTITLKSPRTNSSTDRKSKKGQGGDWLNPEALARIQQGPTKEDGHGHIYIYRIHSPICEADKNCYKIGLSKDLPARRIYAQEKANKQKYDALFTRETPQRYLTETAIHRQLKSHRTPRTDGDGKTEWFTGDLEKFKTVIKEVIREVEAIYSE